MQVLSKFYFHDTPEQDQRAWERYGLSGPMSAIRPGLLSGQGWGKKFRMFNRSKMNRVYWMDVKCDIYSQVPLKFGLIYHDIIYYTSITVIET